MKKTIFLAVIVAFTLAFAGCGNNRASREVWYTSVVLNDSSASVLRQYAQANLPWPKDSFYYSCEHMTTCHMNECRKDLEAWNIEHEGETVCMTATHVGHSDKAFAVLLACDVPVASGVPHVTLAVNLTNGGAAVDSKYITEWLPLSTPIALSGHIVVHYRTEDSIDR